MPGFFPHISSPTAAFTALGRVAATGILDSIVTDVGAGVNGWSLWDDLRSNGASYPVWAPLYVSQGNYSQYIGGTDYGWYFRSGSSIWTGYQPYGFSMYYAISSDVNNPTVISADSAGSTTYNAYYSGYANNYATATLDRPYAGATANLRQVYRKVSRQIVLRCISPTKTFYVWLGTPAEGQAGGPYLYIRLWETWNPTTHVGVGGSQMEHIRFWTYGNAPTWWTIQYLLWLLPDAFALWTGGDYNGLGYPNDWRFTYAGNLDTSGQRLGDTDALVLIASDTSLTGLGIPCNRSFQYNGNTIPGGGIQCLRTLAGEPWCQPGYQGSYYLRNSYQIYPRGRWYGNLPDAPQMDSLNHFEFTDIDLWHMGGCYGNQYAFQGSELRRGMLRYVKMPISNPSGLHLATTGPALDGNQYIIFRQSQPYMGQFNNGAAQTILNYESYNTGIVDDIMTGWGWTSFPNANSNPWGEFSANGGNGNYPNFLMMPIS